MEFNEGLPQQHTVKDFLAIIFKHQKKVIVLSLVIVLAVLISTLITPEIYQADAKLFVRMGNQTMSQQSGAGPERIQISQTMDNQLNTEVQILQSRELAESIYDAMGKAAFREPETGAWTEKIRSAAVSVLSFPKTLLAWISKPDPVDPALAAQAEKDATIEQIRGQLQAEVIPDSNIIAVRYEDNRPARAHAVLENLIDLYMSRHIALNNSPASYDFFREQSDALRRRLETAETELKEAKNAVGVGSLEENRGILSRQIGTLQQQLETTESDIASSNARIGAIEARLDKLPENTIVSETTGGDRSRVEEGLNDLKMKEQELLSTFTPDSVPVAEIRRQIREAETLAEKNPGRQVTMGANPMHQQLKLTLMMEYGTIDALRAQQTEVRRQHDAAVEKLKHLNIAEVKLSRLSREKGLLEENYRKYAGNLEQVRIDQAKEIEKISNITVAQAPVVPIEPVRPRKMLNLVLGLFLALFGGLGMAFFLEYLDDKVRKPEDVESILELPVLGSIRKLETDD